MSDLKNKKILVVDDEDDLRSAIKFELEMESAVVFEASGGQAALDLLQKQEVDLIISDIQMPQGNGVELLNKVKVSNIKTPIVMLITGYSDLSLEDAYHKGVESFLSKPFDPEDLVKKIKQALSKSKNNSISLKTHIEQKMIHLQSTYKESSLSSVVFGRGGFFITDLNKLPNIHDLITFDIHFLDSNLPNLVGEGVVRWVRSSATAEGRAGLGIEVQFLQENSQISWDKILLLVN